MSSLEQVLKKIIRARYTTILWASSLVLSIPAISIAVNIVLRQNAILLCFALIVIYMIALYIFSSHIVKLFAARSKMLDLVMNHPEVIQFGKIEYVMGGALFVLTLRYDEQVHLVIKKKKMAQKLADEFRKAYPNIKLF